MSAFPGYDGLCFFIAFSCVWLVWFYYGKKSVQKAVPHALFSALKWIAWEWCAYSKISQWTHLISCKFLRIYFVFQIRCVEYGTICNEILE